MPTARNYGLDAGRMAACSAGGAARRPAPVESIVDLGPTYTAKPYASWPGWYVNYRRNVRYSISSITIILTLESLVAITGKMTGKKLRTNGDDY